MYLNDLFDVPGELNWTRLDLYEILNTWHRQPLRHPPGDGGAHRSFESNGSLLTVASIVEQL